MSVKGIVTVNESNRVGAIKYGPYTEDDATASTDHFIPLDKFPDKSPLGALFNPTDNSFTYDDAWTAEQERLYSSEGSE